MGSLTSRGRALVVVAFVLSAALCGGAAVALVAASRDDAASPSALPTVNPTLIAPSQSPTPSPGAVSPTPVVTSSPRPSATPSPTATVTSSSAPRATTSPRPASPRPSPTGNVAVPEGLEATAAITVIDAEQGKYVVKVHATDGSGSIYLKSVDWGDQTEKAPKQRGTACSPAAAAPADCRDYSVPHTYADPSKDRIVTVEVISGTENAVIHLTIDVTQ